MKDVIQKLLVMMSKNNSPTTSAAEAFDDTSENDDHKQALPKTSSLSDDEMLDENANRMEPECIPTPKMKLYERLRQKTSNCAPEDTATQQDEDKVRHVRMCIEGRWGYYSGPVWKPNTPLKGCVVRFDSGDLYIGSIYNDTYCGLGKYYPKKTKTNCGRPINIDRTSTSVHKQAGAASKLPLGDESTNNILVKDYY